MIKNTLILLSTIAIILSCTSNSTALIDNELVKMANQINENCPMVIDKETRLINVVALPNKKIKYNYSFINFTHSEIQDLNLLDLKPNILEQYKTDPNMKSLTKYEVTAVYSYVDKNGHFIESFKITPEEYN